MKIAITADPNLPVPPVHYGGIERIVDLLVRGLVDRGHDVTLLAHADSAVPCRLVAYPDVSPAAPLSVIRYAARVMQTVAGNGFDVVHSFGRLAYVAPLLSFGPPVLMTYQRPITRRTVRLAKTISLGRLELSAVSRHMVRGLEQIGHWHVVYNAVSEKSYRFRAECPTDAPLVFLGRVELIKGVHLAVEVAARSGRRLIIAGNVPACEEHQAYFRELVAPAIDGEQIRYVGPVNDATKAELLGGAAGLLMPILWNEPFGIVMAESLACGTPVIGLARGSVPEVVDHGVTGFVCTSTDDMVAAVARLGEIHRADCRKAMERRFSAAVLVDAYESIYEDMVSKPARARDGGSRRRAT